MAQTSAQQGQPGRIDVHRLMAALSEILSDKYDMKITMTAVPKDSVSSEMPEPVSA